MRAGKILAVPMTLIAGICAGLSFSAAASAAPSIECELRLGAWCITDGAYETDRQLAQDSIHDRVWTLRGQFRPESKLVVLEPNGCGGGHSDIRSLLGFQQGYQWGGRIWDRAQVRLKSDGTCDLTLLFPAYSGDPMEWAMPQGFRLIRSCSDDACAGGALTAISDQILVRHKENKK